MDTTPCIAQTRIKDFATIRVVRVSPNEVITCDRNCACIEESRNGSVQCSIGWIKKMVNFQTKALIIDYEITIDRKSEDEWSVHAADFPIIDENGLIYVGEFICSDIVSPEPLSDEHSHMYPGTKATFRVYYETFPKDGKIASIIVECSSSLKSRIDLLSASQPEVDFEEERQEYVAPVQQQDDLRERVEALEKEVANLRRYLRSFIESRASKEISPNNPNRPMSDPGIGYHPLDNK